MARVARSPYLALSWEGNDLVVVDGSSGRRHRLGASALRVLDAADQPAAPEKLAEISRVAIEVVLALIAGRLLVDPDTLGAGSYWNPYELVVQRMRSIGRKRPGLRRVDMPSPRKSSTGAVIPLEATVGNSVLDRDPVFFGEVLKRRRSCRRFADTPLSLATVATFLRSSFAVQHSAEPFGSGVTWRPSPSGGGRHPLEVYLWPVNVPELPPAVYRFDPFESVLRHERPLSDWFARMPELLRAQNDLMAGDPAVIFLVTAVFARTMWKYENNGLSIVYQDLGALYQTWYLVATALGLGGCVLNGGNELQNSRNLGLDPLEESHVGGFLLGVPRDEGYQDPVRDVVAAGS